MNSAYLFFVKTAILLYLANRVYLARSRGGNAWLGVVPPVIGMVIFFVGDHWELLMRTLTLMDHADLNTLAREILNVIYLPIELGMMAVTGAGAELATLPAIARIIDPVAKLTDDFATAHQRYRAAYLAINTLQ